MGGVAKTIGKITGNDTIGRIGGGLLTGGLSEFGRKDSFGLPASIAGPLKIGAGTVAGGMLGGPAGSFLGGTLGGALGGNTMGGLVGGGIGGLLQSLIAGGGGGMDPGKLALGGSLLGLGMAQDTDVRNVNLPSWAQDKQAIQQESASQGNLINNLLERQRGLYGEQNDLLGQKMQGQRDTLMKQLTEGPEGEAFRQKYNNLGLLNSGAFNTGLANQFGNLASQQQQSLLDQGISQTGGLSNILNQGYNVQSGLGTSGLQRQFGLEDVSSQFDIARAIQDAQQKSQLQQGLLNSGSFILGNGMQGGGGGGGAPASGGGGGLFGGSGDFLSSLGSGTGNLISSLLSKFRGGGATPQPSMGSPLNLYNSSDMLAQGPTSRMFF